MDTEASGVPGDGHSARNQAQTEAAAARQMRQQRLRLFPRAALVGLLAGGVAIAFRAVLLMGDRARNALIDWSHHRFPGFGWIFPVMFCAAGASLAVLLARRFAPEAAGSGIPHLEAVLLRLRELRWERVLPIKFFGGAIAAGVGMALGREGPCVQMGGSVGAAVSQWMKTGPEDRLALIAAGAAAGLAAAFNTPLAGVLFVLEEVQKEFRQAVFGSVLIAAAVAAVTTEYALGGLSMFTVPSYPVPSLAALPVFVVLGLLAGLLGIAYNRSLVGSLDLFAKLPPPFLLAATAVIGGLVGLTGWLSPGAIGSGFTLAEAAVSGNAVFAAIPLWFLLRFALSTGCYGTGAPGGIFLPMLVLGALAGLGVGHAAHLFNPDLVPIPAVFAVAGMAAFFTAVVRTPFTGIMLIMEMTHNYAQFVPLVVACFFAYVVAEALGELPIYERLLQRDLLRAAAPSVTSAAARTTPGSSASL